MSISEEDKVPLTQEKIDAFRLNYYKQMDVMYWKDRISYITNHINKVKSPQIKSRSIIDIYSVYIQICEIVVIHMHSSNVKPAQFIRTLAIRNNEIVKFAESVVKNSNYQSRFITEFVNGAYRGEQYDEQNRFEQRLLNECLEDYVENHDFLNAYKHGYRVNSLFGPNYLAIGIEGMPMTKLVEGDSSISYFHVTGNSKKGNLASIDITFNFERVRGKALFLVHILENMCLSNLAVLGQPEELRYTTFGVHDKDLWNKSIGKTRFPKHLYEWDNSSKKEKK